jgi:hypothetical protein
MEEKARNDAECVHVVLANPWCAFDCFIPEWLPEESSASQ